MMLGDLGARIVKVEAPGRGDDTRGWGPPFVGPEDDRQSTYFLSANRNKESIALDLKADADREVLLQLVDRADVLVENFRTGVLERLGLGIDSLHGAQPAAGGAVHHRLRPRRPGGRARRLRPDRPGRGRPDVADRLRSRRSAARRRPDRRPAGGDVRRVRRARRAARAASATGPRTGACARRCWPAVVGVHAFQGTRWTVAGEVGRAQGNHHPSISPYGLFHCRDGAVQIAVGSEGLWRRLCDGFGLDPATPGLETNGDRVGTPRAHHRVRRGGLRRLGRRAPARPARRGRRAGGQGAQPRRGLRVGPDEEPGAADRRRAPSLGPVTLPGPAAALLRRVRRRDHPPRARARLRSWTSTASRARPGWRRARHERSDRHRAGPSLGRRGAAGRSSSTGGPGSPGTGRSTSAGTTRRTSASSGGAGRRPARTSR